MEMYREKHDDRVMARAIGLWVDGEMDAPVITRNLTKEEKERRKIRLQRPNAPEIVGF